VAVFLDFLIVPEGPDQIFSSRRLGLAEILNYGYLSRNYSINEMESPNYGRKGSCFLTFVLFFLLFIILLVWVYYKNFKLAF